MIADEAAAAAAEAIAMSEALNFAAAAALEEELDYYSAAEGSHAYEEEADHDPGPPEGGEAKEMPKT